VDLRVGTSGWQYSSWRRGAWYPLGLAQREELSYTANHFPTVEVNATFYRLPERDAVARWAAAVPEHFRFAVKASRYLTHIRRLRDPQEPVARMLDRIEPLGAKCGPVLIQLPPNLRPALERLDETLSCFPAGAQVAVEPRHPDWFGEPLYELLSSHDAALCLTDRRNRVGPLVRTATWGYVRLHEGVAAPRPCYGEAALAKWSDRLHEMYEDSVVWVYFNNDPNACAPHNAQRLRRFAEHGGARGSRAWVSST
jgi:uncharacterized protein YecE (DUF72 family)